MPDQNIEPSQYPVQVRQQTLARGFEHRHSQTLRQRLAHAHHGVPALQQLREPVSRTRRGLPTSQLRLLMHHVAGDHPRIAVVGLAALANGLRIVFERLRIEHIHPHTRRVRQMREQPVVNTGGFHSDHRALGQTRQPGCDRLGTVVHLRQRLHVVLHGYQFHLGYIHSVHHIVVIHD